MGDLANLTENSAVFRRGFSMARRRKKERKKKRKEEKKEEEKIGRKTRKGDNEAYYSYQK